MSAPYTATRGGDFATARRGGVDAYEIGFIRDKIAAGLPVSQISKQLGRPIADLLPYVPPPTVAQPESVERSPRPVIVIREPPPAPIGRKTREYIAACVAARHGVTVEDLRGDRVWRLLTVPRQEAMWLMMQEGRWSKLQVGRWFGGRDHTTVIHACKAHERRMAEGPQIPTSTQEVEDRRAKDRQKRARERRQKGWRPSVKRGDQPTADQLLWMALRRGK